MNLWASEYGSIWLGSQSRQMPGGDLELAPEQFMALKSLLQFDDEAEANNSAEQFFKLGMRQGRECLRIQNYVGVMQCPGAQIEVLPKLARNTETPERARTLLVKMLAALEDSPFKESESASLNAHKMPLFEIVYRDFVEKAAATVRRGLARTYVAREGNLFFLRGKLKVSEQIKHNAARADRVYCEFDEYELDRPSNRLLVSALQAVTQRSGSAQTKHRCRELLFHFDDLPGSRDIRADFLAVVRDRNIMHYQRALDTARLILMILNPLTQSGTNEATAMLFPMERVFESYLAKQLEAQYPRWDISAQTQQKFLVADHSDRQIFALKPDLLFKRQHLTLVADTKWKLINEFDRAHKYGISQADMYQLFAYGQKYLEAQPTKITVLIYPKTDQFSSPLAPFWFEESRAVLYVTPYDCELDEWLLPGELNAILQSDAHKVEFS